ncbi:hypothetical protein, variant 1 [Aphanomyces invadans]|uniref:F-box/LRR-repeat protein 15-like leucin rich repeat domain-containing protein n=1 Tax=Aphanomyces invadans TaxID=157072 RepID=A0A024UC63_9STRA|nr:hypothetical protein, variant 1 [Aphanomyces invadans]ETW03854.1 hypothetical protein, variant 1 [Aphanomyces invadans]|eukprot:XP_008868083.1 hypothetical protein, variant 1 [Aphanomyces invadans]
MALRTYTQLQHSSPKLVPARILPWDAGQCSTQHTVRTLVEMCVQALVVADGSPLRKVDALFPRLPEELAQSLLAALVAHGKVTDDRLSAFLSISRRVIRLGGCGGIRKSVLRQIPFRCPHLAYLDLSNCIQVSNTVVRDILQGCTTLQQLRLDNCRHITDAAFQPDQSLFYPLRACLSLRVLSLAGCSQLTHCLILYLLKAYRSLDELNFSRCKRITSESVRLVLTSAMHLRLRVLNVSFTDITDDAFLAVMSLSQLQEVDLGQCKITDAALFSLARHCSSLEVVRLRWCSQVTDAGIMRLASSCLQLRALDLNNCGLVTDLSLAALRACPRLERLNVAWCVNITDSGVADLARGCRALQEATFTYCTQLTDAALGSLVQSCPRLKCLHLTGCTGITAAAIAAMPFQAVTSMGQA